MLTQYLDNDLPNLLLTMVGYLFTVQFHLIPPVLLKGAPAALPLDDQMLLTNVFSYRLNSQEVTFLGSPCISQLTHGRRVNFIMILRLM